MSSIKLFNILIMLILYFFFIRMCQLMLKIMPAYSAKPYVEVAKLGNKALASHCLPDFSTSDVVAPLEREKKKTKKKEKK